jgi:hypothetical protein
MSEPATPAQSPGTANPPAAPAPRHALRLPSTPERPLDAWAQRRLVADARALVAGERAHAPSVDHLRALLAWLDGRAETPALHQSPQRPPQRPEPPSQHPTRHPSGPHPSA